MTAPKGMGFGPTTAGERIEAVDVVRGFALWGVLLINMMNFGALWDVWSGWHNELADWVQRFFFEQKSWRLFSFLFGFGFSLQILRAKDRGAKFLPVYVRRLLILLGFGFLNWLFYFGDILTSYALLGFLLLLFWRVPPRALLVIAAAMFLVWPIRTVVAPAPPDPELVAVERQVPGDIAFGQTRLREASSGSLIEHWRLQASRFPEHADPAIGWRGSESELLFFAMFLLGLYAGKRRIFHEPERHRRLIRSVFVWGGAFGIAAMTLDWVFRDVVCASAMNRGVCLQGLPDAARFLGAVTWNYGATALSLSYAAGLVMLCRRERWQRLLHPLAAMGRTALTVYLTQSLAFTTLFFAFGFGQYGRVGPAGVFGFAALIYAGQLAVCTWWIKYFRFGPFEWVWRTLTYLRLQPMRRDATRA